MGNNKVLVPSWSLVTRLVGVHDEAGNLMHLGAGNKIEGFLWDKYHWIMFPSVPASKPCSPVLELLKMARMWQCKQNYLLDIDLPYLLAIFFFRMAHPVELNPYEHAKCVQIYGWKCLICSVEAKDQMGLNCSIYADGIVNIYGIDGTMWVCCQKCKIT